jgi:hypothetical protein
MSHASRRTAGIVLVLFPTVVFGGVSLLRALTGDPEYSDNALRQDLWRAGHAHAGVLLILTLVALRYVDEATLSEGWKKVVRWTIPSAAILLPVAYFLSVPQADDTDPNVLINLAYVGAVALTAGLATLGIGLLKGVRARGAVRETDG